MEITDPLNASTVHGALREVLPEDAIVVLKIALLDPRAAQPAAALGARLRTSAPAAASASASRRRSAWGSADPDRPVVCVLGEGSAQYAITAFWSAVG